MKSIKVFGFLFLASCPIMATASLGLAKTIFGIDIGTAKYKFENEFGDKIFKASHPKANIYANVKFNDIFGIQLGYETTVTKNRDVTLSAGSNSLGVLNSGANGNNFSFSSKSRIKGLHAGVTADLPLHILKNLSFHGDIGFKRTKVTLQRNLNHIDGNFSSGERNLLTNDNKKTILRVSAGVKYLFNQYFGVRLLGNWENTSKFKPHGLDEAENLIQAKMKNAFGGSIGTFLAL